MIQEKRWVVHEKHPNEPVCVCIDNKKVNYCKNPWKRKSGKIDYLSPWTPKPDEIVWFLDKCAKGCKWAKPLRPVKVRYREKDYLGRVYYDGLSLFSRSNGSTVIPSSGGVCCLYCLKPVFPRKKKKKWVPKAGEIAWFNSELCTPVCNWSKPITRVKVKITGVLGDAQPIEGDHRVITFYRVITFLSTEPFLRNNQHITLPGSICYGCPKCFSPVKKGE